MTTDNLWWLVAPQLVWAAHFGGSYALVSVGCQRLGGQVVQPAVVALTIVCLSICGAFAWRGVRRLPASDRDGDDTRRGFLAWSTVALSALAAAGILASQVAVGLVGGCP